MTGEVIMGKREFTWKHFLALAAALLAIVAMAACSRNKVEAAPAVPSPPRAPMPSSANAAKVRVQRASSRFPVMCNLKGEMSARRNAGKPQRFYENAG